VTGWLVRAACPWYALDMAGNSEARESISARLRRNLGPAAKKAGQGIGKALKVTARAAETTTKVVAIRATASAKELKIRGLFHRIGESFYKGRKAGRSAEENTAALEPLIAQVDKLKREIAALKKQEKAVRASR